MDLQNVYRYEELPESASTKDFLVVQQEGNYPVIPDGSSDDEPDSRFWYGYGVQIYRDLSSSRTACSKIVSCEKNADPERIVTQ